jgi:hypothetical protein
MVFLTFFFTLMIYIIKVFLFLTLRFVFIFCFWDNVGVENNPEQPINQQPQTQQTPINEIPNSKSRFKLILLIIILLLIIGRIVYLLEINQGKILSQYFQRPTPTVIPLSPTLTPNPTALWKAYMSTDREYSFQFPGDWYVENPTGQMGSFINFFKTGDKPVHTTDSKWGNETLRLTDYSGVLFSSLKDNLREQIAIDGKEALLDDTGGMAFVDILIYKISNNSDRILHIDFNKGAKPYLGQILSSFRFIDRTTQITPANWETYNSDKMGKGYAWEFKYPKGFKILEESTDVRIIFPDSYINKSYNFKNDVKSAWIEIGTGENYPYINISCKSKSPGDENLTINNKKYLKRYISDSRSINNINVNAEYVTYSRLYEHGECDNNEIILRVEVAGAKKKADGTGYETREPASSEDREEFTSVSDQLVRSFTITLPGY